MKLIRIDGTVEEVEDPRVLLQTAPDDLTPSTSSLGSIGYRDLDPHGRLVADPETLIWRPHAFRAFGTASEYRTIRGIIGRSVRPKKRVDPRLDAAALPPMRCGALDADGRRCGSKVRAEVNRWNNLRYNGATCEGHCTDLGPAIESIVLTLIGAAFAPEAMRVLAPAMALESRSLDRQLTRLREDIGATEERIVQLTRSQLDAHDSLRAAASLTLAYDLEERARLQRMIADAEDALHRLVRPATRDRIMHVLQSMATRLAHVLTRLQRSPTLCRRLVQALTQGITVHCIADHMVQLEITYATGACAEYLVILTDFHSTQPQRLWAYEQLVRGRAQAEVASELDVGPARRYRSRVIQPSFVRTLALAHRWFEPTPTLSPELGESVQSLAKRTRSDVDILRQFAMAGQFGAARVDAAGSLVLMPTELQLEDSLPEYARRRVGERTRWSGRAITRREAIDQSGQKVSRLESWVSRGILPRAQDLSGRIYFDSDALDHCLSAHGLTRDVGGTQKLFDCAREGAVVAAGFPPQMAGDFHLQSDLLALLRERGIATHSVTLQRRIAEGRLLSIPYAGPASSAFTRTAARLIYFPRSVASEGDAEEVQRYLEGEMPHPMPTETAQPCVMRCAPRRRRR